MVTLSDILDAVSGALHGVFPDRYCYVGRQPKGFERPSLFLELVTARTRRCTIGTAETDVYLTVTLHEPMSPTRTGDQLLCLQDMDRILKAFGLGILRVCGRALPILAESGGQDGGEGYVDLSVTVRDGIGWDPEKGLEQMQTVNMVMGPERDRGGGKA